MFDSVGKSRKQDPVRRVTSLLLSLLLNGGFVGALWYIGSKVVDQIKDEVPVEVTFFDQAPPPPPPPPPAAAAPKPKIDRPKPPDAEPDPVPLPDEIPEPPPEEPEQEASGDPNATGQPCGGPGQPPCGPPCGGPGQPECGPPCGGPGQPECGPPCGMPGLPACATGPRAVHWSEVKSKKRVDPKFPEAAKQLGLTEATCRVRFFIDEKGDPYDIKLETCPKVFEDATLEAAWAWRFYPMKIEGKAAKAQFVLSVKYVLK